MFATKVMRFLSSIGLCVAACVVVQLASLGSGVYADDANVLAVGKSFAAVDTFKPPVDQDTDAQECLNGLCWTPDKFQVTLEPSDGKNGDWLVRFPSPLQTGDQVNDRVAMEWYMAKDANKNPVRAPAAVIVHESGSGMTVGRIIAAALGRKGIHAFMIQLPHYGNRRGPNGKPTGDKLVSALRQGILDVRRGRDAVASIPWVENDRISLQGTSLGGFVASTTAGVEPCFHRVILLLSGGDLYSVMTNGKKDAAKMKEELQKNGITLEQMRENLRTIEPLRLAHRLNPGKTWLYSGEYDDVVPLENAKMLAKKIPLEESHHIIMQADHYSGAVMLPTIVQQMAEQMTAK